MKLFRYITATGFILILSACSTVSSGGYYWGAYSASYFSLVKDTSAETKAARILALEDIIEKSSEKNLRVPPGVYAEVGALYIERGDTELGREFLAKEKSVYPESSVFIDRILNQSAVK